MKILLIFVIIVFTNNFFAQKTFSSKSVLGHELGTEFSTHAQVVDYFEELNRAFPNNSKLEIYGESNEGRTLQLMFIGNENTIKNLEQIRNKHLNSSINENIPIVWLSYNVHGNESSGTEAAMETALILLRDKKEWLDDVLIIIDPCLNPDGRDRYVNFFKQYSTLSKNSNV